jgi:two-component system, cell cycle sensor histidine kinase and response regulator CckA
VVINACQATPEKGKLLVRAENVYEATTKSWGLLPGRHVKIEIEDRGSGIPENIKAKLFEICLTRKSRGDGFGLHTVKSIMRQHGGDIFVDSLVGRGTMVSLILPALPIRSSPRTESLQNSVVKTTGRILVIDDDETVLTVIGLLLSSLGYEWAIAKDGIEGCNSYVQAKADGVPFAAVLLDATIPNGLSGEQTLILILAADPNARVILCSGYSDNDRAKSSETLGFKAFLPKPFNRLEIATVLQKVLA